ncbi:MAG: sensor histidine kinase [Bacteroidia bacterium]|nr:sensor histidine kinase [Bacteroidia bacterium]
MRAWVVLIVSFSYLASLFGVAYWADKMRAKGKSLIRNPIVYALSLAVYCTAWTFYGSVGRAATHGIEFLAIYIGPTLSAPLWILILRKIIVISRSQRINSIADFISSRYGKSSTLGGLVTIIAIVAIIPYISLQLKAVSTSFELLTQQNSFVTKVLNGESFFADKAFYVAVILGLFTIFFGTRHLEAPEHHEGLVAAVAFESIVKLLAFLAVGIFVCFFLFDGFGDLFSQAMEVPDLHEMYNSSPSSSLRPWNWFWLNLISMFAILFLPRQFHVAVVENTNPNHVKKAIWLFPLYLLLINIFVIPIALGGRMFFPATPGIADTYVLQLPLENGQNLLALLVYIGGLSASTSMVIVATIALSIMASNNLIVPILLRTSIIKESFERDISSRLMGIRRLVIISILMIAYAYFSSLGQNRSLVSIGLISFVGVAQFAPSVLGGIFWRGGNRKGAIAGLLLGFIVWGFTLPFVSLLPDGATADSILENGVFGWGIFRPYALMGLEGMDQISHATFWSLFVNLGAYVFVSLLTSPSALEHSQANLFVNIYQLERTYQEKPIWKGKAYLFDIENLLARFLGPRRTETILNQYAAEKGIKLTKTKEVDFELINHAEKQLAGAIGAASARLLISSVVKEEPPKLREVMEALDETHQLMRYSKELEQKSDELRRASEKLQLANARLKEMDKLKNDFLTTVTHELRTPITSIRALTTIVHDNKDLDEAKRHEFLGIVIKECERISRLINQVLDLEKMESGHAEWNLTEVDMLEIVSSTASSIKGICKERNIKLIENYPDSIPLIIGDRDRLVQVVMNLLSNAVKFCDHEKGEIKVTLELKEEKIQLMVQDNGIGLKKEVLPYIFDKFSQFTDLKSGRPHGSGLGLSITWRIVHLHKGSISVESKENHGASFLVELPLEKKIKSPSRFSVP